MKEDILTTDEGRKLLKAIQEKGTNCDEMKKLKLAMSGFTVSSARQHMNKGLAFGDLIDAGMEGLRRAVMKYDVNSDTNFYVYGAWEIHQAMIQAIKEKK
ncbi:sigma factor [Xylanibacter ruminicola]|uniref:RNA polymerase primary sigma factor n=1 Tax=Xylanibacter ruminicola TaxID=839 RepID=A0A1M6VDV3_XYLRU|nr:sigma factor [Xylanibacter ruminicola]SHK79618.1 RNA polymerase primary sigma factor [Xylanibacter ruminicola]